MIFGRARWFLPAAAVFCFAASLNYRVAEARPTGKALVLKVDPELRCFEEQALRNALVQEIGRSGVRGWRLQLERSKSQALRLSLYRGRSRIGTRSFTQLPEDCPAQRRLVATVVGLAIENWRSERVPTPARQGARRPSRPTRRRGRVSGRQGASKPSSETASEGASRENPGASGVEAGRPDANPSSDSLLPQDPTAAQENPVEGTAPRDGASSLNTQEPSSEDQEETKQGTEPSEQADPRALARAQARQNRRRPKQREPFRLEKGLALGVLWGSMAQPGPEFQGWLAAKRPRLSLRGKIHLAYGPPRRLGPAKVHTALALFAVEICGRGGSAPAGALEFWACLGWQGGGLWGGGTRSDQNLQGFRPFTAPTLALEFPLAFRRQQHFFLRLQGGANLLRTRLELQDFDGEQSIVHRYLLPAYHVALSVGWRR